MTSWAGAMNVKYRTPNPQIVTLCLISFPSPADEGTLSANDWHIRDRYTQLVSVITLERPPAVLLPGPRGATPVSGKLFATSPT